MTAALSAPAARFVPAQAPVDLGGAAGAVPGGDEPAATGLCRAQSLGSRLAEALHLLWRPSGGCCATPCADGRRDADLHGGRPVAGLAAGAQQPAGPTPVGRGSVPAVRRAGVRQQLHLGVAELGLRRPGRGDPGDGCLSDPAQPRHLAGRIGAHPGLQPLGRVRKSPCRCCGRRCWAARC
jgi:hypothetical protein